MINNNEKTDGISRLTVSKVINIVYFITVILLGMSSVCYSISGNLGTLLAFISGNREFYIEALLYGCITEIIFESFAILGGGLCLYQVIKENTAKIIPNVLIHLLITVSYISSKIALVQGVVHLSTQGEIKNTEMWDFQFISSYLIGLNSTTYKALYLIAGLILILIFKDKNKLKQ